MSERTQHIQEATDVIRRKSEFRPDIAIILGTGLGALAKEIEVEAVLSYEDLPHFPISTVETHAGKLLLGRMSGNRVVVMQGRFHYYEGYSMQQITFPVRVMKALGAETLIVSNIAGGMNPFFRPGDLILIADHINLLGDNPLIGPNDDDLGPRFPDMSEPYSRALIALAEQVASEEKIKIQKGVYVAVPGPNLETPAEYRFLRLIGADMVGMSTVPEVIVAIHAGMKVVGFTVISDACFPDALEPVDIRQLIKTVERTEPQLTRLIKRVVERM